MKFLGVFFICIFISAKVFACSCMEPSKETAIESYNQSDVIVRASVVEVSEGFSSLGPLVRLDVHEVIKGKDIPDFITANYNINLAACGQRFTEGEEVVLALYDTRDVRLRVDNARGYGFRVMISCYQQDVRYFLDNLENKEEN